MTDVKVSGRVLSMTGRKDWLRIAHRGISRPRLCGDVQASDS
jgi:hypothetical protein